jgi:YfiR/HmsC-like
MRLTRSGWPQPPGWIRLVALSLLANASMLFAGDASSEYQVKAAFLLNFPNFVGWPTTAFGAATDPLILGIFGKDPFGGALDQMAKTKTINGRPILIRVLSDPRALRFCHVVFFPASHMNGSEQVVTALSDLGILTVGESSSFAERGVMINFVIEDRHVRFEVNPWAVEHGHLQMSSKLLQLAIIVGKASPQNR